MKVNMGNNISSATLLEVSSAIQGGDVSSVEVTRACIEKIESQQSRINCFVSIRTESALESAAQADAEISRGLWRGPLHGVPLAHKDMFYRAGEVTGFGSKICKDFEPDETSDVMVSIDDAGAIDLGPLHMTEFAVGHTGVHEHLGYCRNPWNTDRIPGGSSSGSAAAVAARLIYGSIASDTGGSCRLPASMCGVVGIKPTFGLVSRFGGMPRAWSLDVFGVYARTVEDAGILLEVIAGESGRDPATYGIDRPAYDRESPVDLNGYRIGVPKNEGIFQADSQVQAIIDTAVEELRTLGCEVVETELPDLDKIAALGGTILLAEAATIHDEWTREIPDQYSEAVVWRLQQGHHIPATRYLQAQRLRPKITEEFVTQVYGSVDAVLTPTITMPVLDFETANSFNSAEASGEIFETTKCTVWANYLGLPGMSVPCGFTPDGLPVGFQIVARPFDEATLLSIGRGYQTRTSWHQLQPPEVDNVRPDD
jgi:aspartyl-tRNA(Asn)/glutamyl-tRNA(Gln) amidotransferase subunit A